MAFPAAGGKKSWPCSCKTPPGPRFPPVPYLPDQRLPLGGVYEQTPSQTFIERPVGAPRAGAADAGVLGMQQRVSVFPSTAPSPCDASVIQRRRQPPRGQPEPAHGGCFDQEEQKLASTLPGMFSNKSLLQVPRTRYRVWGSGGINISHHALMQETSGHGEAAKRTSAGQGNPTLCSQAPFPAQDPQNPHPVSLQRGEGTSQLGHESPAAPAGKQGFPQQAATS